VAEHSEAVGFIRDFIAWAHEQPAAFVHGTDLYVLRQRAEILSAHQDRRPCGMGEICRHRVCLEETRKFYPSVHA
jgi:hypothetical protein